MGHREFFKGQQFWIVEYEDESQINSTKVCKRMKGKTMMPTHLTQVEKIKIVTMDHYLMPQK